MRFITAHSSAPDWPQALRELSAQVAQARSRADTVTRPNLGVLYAGPGYAAMGDELLRGLRERLGVEHWVGGIVPGVFASTPRGIESCDVALMLGQFAQRDFRVFSGRQPLPPASRLWRGAHTLLVHGDAEQEQLDELLAELGERCASGDVWGGAVSGEFGAQIADVPLHGGLSGVAFSGRVPLLGGMSQGLEPVGPLRTVTRCADNVVYALDGEPALDALLHDLGEPSAARPREQWRELVPSLREVVVGLSWPGVDVPGAAAPRLASSLPQQANGAVLRGLIGIDPRAQGVALAAELQPGMQLRFCRRQPRVSLRDLLRLCTEVRDELEQRRDAWLAAGHAPAGEGSHPARGALFVTCASRDGEALRAELELLRAQLGDIALIGFRSVGEFSGATLHAYSSVLRVFGRDPEP